MNPATLVEAKALAKASDVDGLVICPPFLFIEEVGLKIKKAKLGAQDLFWENLGGAFTGEVSAEELKSLGVGYVIIGHSERRKNVGETDEMVAKKMDAALKAGLKPILCVGEPREIRDKGKTKEFVENQLRIDLSKIITDSAEIIVAYEPIWAIGTGNPDTPENMSNMVKFIKELLVKLGSKLRVHIIYGGSVTSVNAESFFQHREIEGALVGGASLKGDEITKIVEIGKKFK